MLLEAELCAEVKMGAGAGAGARITLRKQVESEKDKGAGEMGRQITKCRRRHGTQEIV